METKMQQALIDKFPDFDSKWRDSVQVAWFQSFTHLVQEVRQEAEKLPLPGMIQRPVTMLSTKPELAPSKTRPKPDKTEAENLLTKDSYSTLVCARPAKVQAVFKECVLWQIKYRLHDDASLKHASSCLKPCRNCKHWILEQMLLQSLAKRFGV